MSRCPHQWRWLPQPVFIYDGSGLPRDAHNAECPLCGERTWAHGTMPNARPIIVTITPTTRRS